MSWILIAVLWPFGAMSASSPSLEDIAHLSQPAPHRMASGAIDAKDLSLLKQAGIGMVINLRTDRETPDFDEAAAVRDAGMAYRHLPIDGASGLTRAHVERLDVLLRQAGDTPTLVHCASSNRVGAMIALRAFWLQHRSAADALAEGRRWGLRSLEPIVREHLGLPVEAPHRDAP
ncbi:beta-lactamase hydrolase domain-containing protein [Oleiagrimonas soli]|uniref:Uncharacterized protein (TIGR01244 family) n=1 Tax=Oleiagrimonas soli TaxID=1543381 RepID=A0A841KE60_9GAMM|nr:sulfur transferase domain-containing protein [Oleiagrimonas soli]MBB6183482.1 uncharacterized protein (TIGR01244 family) [Oleiagrimonas soli]